MTRSILLALICLLSAVAVQAQPEGTPCGAAVRDAAWGECDGDPQTCQVWRKFRAAHPYPYQTLAVHPLNAAEAIVVISEPPPVATPQDVATLAATLFGDDAVVRRLRYPVGHDGWLEDVVIRVRGQGGGLAPVPTASGRQLNIPRPLASRLQYLYGALFATTDGFYVDVATERPSAQPLDNPRATAADLGQLLSGTAPIWTPLGGAGRAETWPAMLQRREISLVIDGSGAVVALFIPAGTDPAEIAAEFRRFAVGTDYLIGALTPQGGGLALFGRNRVLGLDVMSPLRFETVLALASSLGQPLGQSYERQRVFAGKIQSGPFAAWDWAPIYLSPQLEDSEFGVLLNLADQQLKSWSERGDIRYARFDYAEPPRFPFGPQPASRWFREKALGLTLIFNWNTHGFARAVPSPDGQILSMLNVTALPVSYIIPKQGEPEILERLRKQMKLETADREAEGSKIGTEYFAGLGDPILARVARNVFLYQALSAARPFRGAVAGQVQKTRRAQAVSGILVGEASRFLRQATMGAGRVPAVVGLLRQSGMTPARLASLMAEPEANTMAIVNANTGLQDRLARVQDLEAQLKEMAVQLLPLEVAAASEFRQQCSTVGGHIEHTSRGMRCEYPATMAGLFLGSAKSRFDQAAAEFDGLKRRRDHDAQALIATFSKLQRLARERKAAEDVSGELRARVLEDDLASVLDRVLSATSRAASQGAIQTPSVVLSCNRRDLSAVGGHNIDALPAMLGDTGTLRVDGGNLVRPPVLKNVPGGASRTPPPDPPARPIREAVGVASRPRSGSFLARLQSQSAAYEGSPRNAELMARAQGCDCDVYVEHGEGDTATVVRLKPPPSVTPVFGRFGLVEKLSALDGSPRLIFKGFGAEQATAISLAASRMSTRNAPQGRGRFGTALREAKALYRAVVGRAGASWSVRASNGKTMMLHGKSNFDQLKATPPWGQARVNTRPLDGSLVEVVFNDPAGEHLGFTVRAYDLHGADLDSARLKSVASSTVLRLRKDDPTLVKAVTRLGERLAQEREVEHVDFFMKDLTVVLRRVGTGWMLAEAPLAR